MASRDSLLRFLAQPWLIGLFAATYAFSQTVIAAIIHPIGLPVFFRLQCSAFTASDYAEAFEVWQRAGILVRYEAHLVVDALHPLWYAGLLVAVMSGAFVKRGVSNRADALLLLPVVAALADCFENHIQSVLLMLFHANTLVDADPLPLLSATASITKWSCVAATLIVIVRFGLPTSRPAASIEAGEGSS